MREKRGRKTKLCGCIKHVSTPKSISGREQSISGREQSISGREQSISGREQSIHMR